MTQSVPTSQDPNTRPATHHETTSATAATEPRLEHSATIAAALSEIPQAGEFPIPISVNNPATVIVASPQAALVAESTEYRRGRLPGLTYGATVYPDGIEFSLLSRHATGVALLLYSSPQQQEAAREIWLNPEQHRFGDRWSIFVPGLRPGQLYHFRVQGPAEPKRGHRFHSDLVLLDPAARAFTSNVPVETMPRPFHGNQNALRPKCVALSDAFDWQGVTPPRHSLAESIIYEMHVRGFTRHPSAHVQAPGTYLGVIEKIPHLLQLGITAVELLPILEFDPNANSNCHPDTREPLRDYWGYNPIAFAAPHGPYAHSHEPGAALYEFKTMVRELHRHGIEVLLDVVFNHTGEGNHLGPTITLKGIDCRTFYIAGPDPQFFADFTGCGNTLSPNHPAVAQFFLECLRYWVTQLHVDGFRFDLASILCRNPDGHLVADPLIVQLLSEDPLLRDIKLIAEAWDAVGTYQVGHFPGGRWAEWNGRYRDDLRKYWRSDPGLTGALATRLTGSSDLYQASGRRPFHSINFITSHDGFTLFDLVSYNEKHNFANGENNRDGDNHNHSFNHGVEGPTDNPQIDRIRLRKQKNYLATLFFSQGVPMLLAGDEVRRTQGGNNNAYCQDNEVSWLDWDWDSPQRELLRFTAALIHFRRRHPVLRREDFFRGKPLPTRKLKDINWYAASGGPKIWEQDNGTLMVLIPGVPKVGSTEREDDDVLLLFNASARTIRFTLVGGDLPSTPWQLFLDTGNQAPCDIFPNDTGPLRDVGQIVPMVPHSFACFHRPAQSTA